MFMVLAGIHLYWGFGGRWGSSAIPKLPEGRPVFRPGLIGCLVVAFGLLAFAYVCLASGSILPSFVPEGILRICLWAMFAMFVIRSGVTGTDFAKWDRLLYTPLCATIAAGVLLLLFPERQR